MFQLEHTLKTDKITNTHRRQAGYNTTPAGSAGGDLPLKRGIEKFTSDQIVDINNMISSPEFTKPSGKPNLALISEKLNVEYHSLRRYVTGFYKGESPRADKGQVRKFEKKLVKNLKDRFEAWYLGNAQKNVKQAIYKVQLETGNSIPLQKAYEWARTLDSGHDFKHYYKTFISRHVPHISRDNFGETENFLDVVLMDVWKIDDPFIPETEREKLNNELESLKNSNKKQWEKQRSKASTAYALSFIDAKTAYPLTIVLCPHSVSGSDVKKGLMRLIQKWGIPKRWYLDNGKEFVNRETIDFLYGVHSGEMEWNPSCTNLKTVELIDDNNLIFAKPYSPYGKGRLERQFRIWKDEHAAYSPSYSPNMNESRKPGLELSCVQPVQFFEGLAKDLDGFIYGEFLTREREMFFHPGFTRSHEINVNRPKTIQEAFSLAYSNYTPRYVDEFLLAYHYADKRKATFRSGVVAFTHKQIKLSFIPLHPENLLGYSHINEAITVLMDPQNYYHCWLFDSNRLLGEAQDIRYQKNLGISKDRASYINKIQNKAIRAQRRFNNLVDEIQNIRPSPVEDSKVNEFGCFIDATDNDEVSVNNISELHQPEEISTNNVFDLYGEDD
jgi:hypothetical protein